MEGRGTHLFHLWGRVMARRKKLRGEGGANEFQLWEGGGEEKQAYPPTF